MRVLPIFCSLLLLVSSGCGTFMSTPPSWRTFPLPKELSLDNAWFLVSLCSEMVALPQDGRVSRKSEGEFVSIWSSKHGHFGKGNRTRLHARFPEMKEGVVNLVEFYVERQVNSSMERSANPELGDWKAAGQDGGKEERFRTHLTIRVNPMEMGTDKIRSDIKRNPFGKNR